MALNKYLRRACQGGGVSRSSLGSGLLFVFCEHLLSPFVVLPGCLSLEFVVCALGLYGANNQYPGELDKRNRKRPGAQYCLLTYSKSGVVAELYSY